MSQDLQREYDKTQVNAFIGSTAALFGAILCTLKMRWDSNIPAAATDGETLFWNPDWFLRLPVNTRKTVLMHELWHVGYLHGVRQGSRDPEFWNYAKLISGVLRYRMPIEHVIKLVYQLQLTSDNINTWKKGVVTALKRYLKDGSLMKLYDDSDSES